MPTLIVPTRLQLSWQQAHSEWGPGLHEDGFGLDPTDDVTSAEGFGRWVGALLAAEEVREGRPRCTFRWIVEGDTVLGGIALRQTLNPRTGHLGYGIRPSARGQGLATWALQEMLPLAADVGLARVLLVCETDNLPSHAVVEKCGGVLETDDPDPHRRRYWINTH